MAVRLQSVTCRVFCFGTAIAIALAIVVGNGAARLANEGRYELARIPADRALADAVVGVFVF